MILPDDLGSAYVVILDDILLEVRVLVQALIPLDVAQVVAGDLKSWIEAGWHFRNQCAVFDAK